MNIIQAYLTIIRNISHYLPHQKNAYRKTAILAAIALGYTTPKKYPMPSTSTKNK